MTTRALPTQSKSEIPALKKVLVPSDFSPASDNAFKYALHFGQHFGAQLHVIHVLEPVLSPRFAGLPGAPAFSEGEPATAEKKLRAWTDSAGAVGVVAKLVLRNGLPAHEIVETAKDLDIDLIVIATHGSTGWKHFCIGSTAERVVRAAPCPVLVVREKEHELSEESKKMKTIASIKKKSGKRLPQKIKAAGPKFSSQPVCLHRRSASEFSCGIDDQRALLVEESLDERERRG